MKWEVELSCLAVEKPEDPPEIPGGQKESARQSTKTRHAHSINMDATANRSAAQQTLDSEYMFKECHQPTQLSVLLVLYDLSQLLNTHLDREQLATCVAMIENGVNPEALAVSDTHDSTCLHIEKLGVRLSSRIFDETAPYDQLAGLKPPLASTDARSVMKVPRYSIIVDIYIINQRVVRRRGSIVILLSTSLITKSLSCVLLLYASQSASASLSFHREFQNAFDRSECSHFAT